ATPRSTAEELVREALERYGVGPEEGSPRDFVLCDVVGRAHSGGGSASSSSSSSSSSCCPGGGGWEVEHLRAVGDQERPLVLLDVWKPKEGCGRRFEIRRR
ncbi:RADIL protein, partial [Tricholaema leucomelas]|nr:RADIL protein [Tricholaema leucomelas]